MTKSLNEIMKLKIATQFEPNLALFYLGLTNAILLYCNMKYIFVGNQTMLNNCLFVPFLFWFEEYVKA